MELVAVPEFLYEYTAGAPGAYAIRLLFFPTLMVIRIETPKRAMSSKISIKRRVWTMSGRRRFLEQI